MKIGIITLIGNNYGNRLQNYAVQEILREYGEVYTVKHERKKTTSVKSTSLFRFTPTHIKEALDSRLLNIYHLSNRNMNTVSRIKYYIKHKEEIEKALSERNSHFRSFDEKYIQYEDETLHLVGDDEEEWVKSYDAWVCGSDQIWNPNYPTATRNAFLQFAMKERRISFSASIGLSNIDVMPREYEKWIKEIPFLSVREEAAADIVKLLTNRVAEVFLDPTMILQKKYWDNMANEAKTNLPSKYALCYFLGIREKEYQNYIAQQLAEKQLQVIELLNGEYSEYLNFGPAEMIDAIRNADVVFVDSFHGAVFSILFHKQFVVFERKETGLTMNSRIHTLLKKFDMEDRVFNGNNHAELEWEIDYSNVDSIIIEEREKVRAFLDTAIREIEKLPHESSKQCKRIQIRHSEKCCGCTACSDVCPKECITMQRDEEGFFYPKVDEQLCIECGKCRSVCPMLHSEGGNIPVKILAEKNKDEKIRSTSSSGGVFYELAASFLKKGGIVYGCALDNDMVARHIRVDNIEELSCLKSSKYVQSDMGQTMKEIRKLLMKGEKILFSGTPCQAAGLRKFLKKEYENLFIVDVLCHGVPSPQLFSDYLELLGEEYGGKPISVNFRNKQRGWKRLYMEVCFDNGNRHYMFSGYDRYESLFLNNMSLRPSCYACKFTKAERFGDVTLGDFWGIGKKYPKWDDDKGISVVMINTEKGNREYKDIEHKFEEKEETFDVVKKGQRTLYAPTMKNPNRDSFYKLYKEKGCKVALETYTHIPSKPVRAYYSIMRWGLDKVRKILKKGY